MSLDWWRGERVCMLVVVKRVLVGVGLIVTGCSDEPYDCEALEGSTQVGRRPAWSWSGGVLMAGDQVPVVRMEAIERTPEELAYRAAVLGCALGLKEVPGSIRSWVEDETGEEPFVVDGIEIRLGDRDRVVASKRGSPTTVDIVPDEVGFSVARDVAQELREHGLFADDGFWIPGSLDELPPLDEPRSEAWFAFHPRVGDWRYIASPYLLRIKVALDADGSPFSVSLLDRHLDEDSSMTLERSQAEAVQLLRETLPTDDWGEQAVPEREVTVYSGGRTHAALSQIMTYRDRAGDRRISIVGFEGDFVTESSAEVWTETLYGWW
jgi:hypothetical protein